LFNWNVKQLFLYLTAEYQTENNEFNQVRLWVYKLMFFSFSRLIFHKRINNIYWQVVLWDKIVLRGDNAVLDFKNMNTKYYFWDDGKGLK